MEFTGTFFLVLTVGLVTIPDKLGPFAALAIGGILGIMVYVGGHVSGAHYNPAVTLAMYLRRKLKHLDFVSYLLSQLLGATLGALLTLYLLNSSGSVPEQINLLRAIICELLFTFALVLTVLSVAAARSTAGNSYYGAAIGGIVAVGVLTVGEISGAVFNPAVALATAILGVLSWGDFFTYTITQLFAAIVAGVVFRMTYLE